MSIPIGLCFLWLFNLFAQYFLYNHVETIFHVFALAERVLPADVFFYLFHSQHKAAGLPCNEIVSHLQQKKDCLMADDEVHVFFLYLHLLMGEDYGQFGIFAL